jgi:ABC-type cobalamin transport system ATPase subunit
VLLQLLLVSCAGLLHHHSEINVGLEDVYHLEKQKINNQHAVLTTKQGATILTSDTIYLLCH